MVVFCLFFGAALIMVPGKEKLLDFLELCSEGIGRINFFLVRLAPIGLFLLTAAAAGTLPVDEFGRLQAYIIIFTLAIAALVVLPLLISSLTDIHYRDVIRAAQEPVLTAIATGKLFVVLPEFVNKCDQLVLQVEDTSAGDEKSMASVLVPASLSFPTPRQDSNFLVCLLCRLVRGKELASVADHGHGIHGDDLQFRQSADIDTVPVRSV